MSSVLNALWRVIFCSIAVSCTLSRIDAHGQRLDRIKDLICVLLLSGLQKEDLDINLLVKLQRYNININDINHEELRNTCGSENFSSPSRMPKDEKESKDENSILRHKNTTFTDVEKNIENFTKQTDNRRILKYTAGQPNIESVMNFWRTMARSDVTETTELHKINTRRAQEPKLVLTNNHFFNETEFINKIITDNNKNQNQPLEIIKPIMPDKYNYNAERIEIGHEAQPIYLNIQPPHLGPNMAFKTYEKVKYENKKVNIPTEQKIDDILKTINQFKSMFSNINSYKNENIHKVHDTHNTVIKLSKVEKINDPVKKNKFVLSPQNLTEELVQKIAQSVKDMVLQDLRKEMQITTTTTTHKVETVSIIQKDNLYKEENVMSKVMSMLQSFKQPTLKINDQGIKTSQSRHNYRVNDFNKYDQALKQIDNPHDHILKADENFKKNKLQAITFQTNSLEIPPLGIPITHGQNPINQNIIVTTLNPLKIHYESDNGASYSDSALMKVYPKEAIQSPLSAKFSKRSDDCPLNHPCNHKNEDVIRFRLGNNWKTKYDTDYYEKINMGRIKDNYEGYSPRAPRFHEKLERADRYEYGELNEDCCRYPITQQMVECCNEKITSRQQTSLGKKRGSYDDTHFRNFLKTQQKVTDMLEQILASKTRDQPVSVETT